jgi:hypothetical protein
MWQIVKLTFDLCMIGGTVLFLGWCALCLTFSRVNRNTDAYQRQHAARDHRVGGAWNP